MFYNNIENRKKRKSNISFIFLHFFSFHLTILFIYIQQSIGLLLVDLKKRKEEKKPKRREKYTINFHKITFKAKKKKSRTTVKLQCLIK